MFFSGAHGVGLLVARGRRAGGCVRGVAVLAAVAAILASAATGPATITLENGGSLSPQWVFQEQPPTGNAQPQGGFSASPTVADGMIFIGSQTGDLYALQQSTGQVVWKRTLDYEEVGNN